MAVFSSRLDKQTSTALRCRRSLGHGCRGVESHLLIATGDPGTVPHARTYIGELRTHVAHSYDSEYDDRASIVMMTLPRLGSDASVPYIIFDPGRTL